MADAPHKWGEVPPPPPQPPPTSVRKVTCACLGALELLEEGTEPLRQRYPSTGGLSRALYQCLRAILHAGPEADAAPALGYVLACADAATAALEDLKTERANYFGAEFREAGPLSTLRNVERKVAQLAASVRGDEPRVEGAKNYVGGALGDDDAEATIPDVPSRLFWIERFGRFSTEVPWPQFARAVAEEFGEQPRGTLELLRPVLGVTARNEFVSMAALGRFSRGRQGGFYGAFVALSDPARVVYAMGTVDDDAQGGEPQPTLVEGLLGLPVASVCCGGQHAAVLTRGGEVYTWGRGGFGRLGHGDTQSLKAPKLVRGALERVRCAQVACGFAYTAAVSDAGALYTWGAGENGRLGLGDVDDRHAPSRVDALWPRFPLKRVNAGSVHTCALGVDGRAYSFGKHEYTGHGASADVLTPRPLDDAFDGRAVREISVGPGGYHTVALVSPADVYTWGHNRVGQLGYSNNDVVPRNGEGAHFVPKPRRVDAVAGLRVARVVAGWGHTALLTADGEAHVCGRNFQGQLGLGDPESFPHNERGHPYQPAFRLLETLGGRRVSQIACGGEHSVALTEDGEVHSCGAGNKGQLGHGGVENEQFPRLVRRLRATRRDVLEVACGNNGTLVLCGYFNPPSLFDRCADVLANSLDLSELEEALPADVVSRVRRARVPDREA
eukprot:CAMPEP_0119261496 /NCGR_PEP_ID=MMETSP1329-20130426/1542_1 /TAXON_ID=114041 /ORGANISM="Genus nov. species nov., Strain RCC1024" /LENGTH=670 /DNA_ID=CAMNT_0007261061 /DNA_START=319 /DNA_END=2327 /DNA_ORIENTATION=+